MPGNTIVDNGYDMPFDMYIKKTEQHHSYLPEDYVEQYQRKSLKDMRPCKPLFESDQPRGGTDENGAPLGNPLSSQIIALRSTGFLNEQDAEPYLEDGTFLDHPFLDKDLRGVAQGPNMKLHTDQQLSRGRFIKQGYDGDDSVPESGIQPGLMIRNIRSGQAISKDYLKIFDTSLDAWSTTNLAPGNLPSIPEMVCDSSEIKDPKQLPNRNIMNITNTLSNDTSIGYRRTTDHMFQVEKY